MTIALKQLGSYGISMSGFVFLREEVHRRSGHISNTSIFPRQLFSIETFFRIPNILKRQKNQLKILRIFWLQRPNILRFQVIGVLIDCVQVQWISMNEHCSSTECDHLLAISAQWLRFAAHSKCRSVQSELETKTNRDYQSAVLIILDFIQWS